ncbi:MAG: Malate dehydrogenase (Oxaloacetate-decarboxylating) [Candidatus Woesebacteria bacterium GW2011_GWA1_33_30]|uniref:Malate dehydrogenase (Oxaloacetate-decarboxylating) n=1 Tax=Candidatus Woesebacteria bacterium GW2011_GWA2_33_28 TaxID=1618561 RepID=A0A0G0A9P3_9BACT|nr:MAG: Malate dehydrogenase (Oxaloacetate-decarboxylating) [Candidatus Woesebacteria bacterium GW2011_GWA2_33_28]KKP48849.1 MAG: Malate dehydrogenase (Oxaloacetate-decarboxylating) [Candidatus Woesebacteria bacterium GW2011_GWA1_33_30]KKP50122.1 MAG: Malate dehydrogenase (Oxaloacetate-decarboxylating) [Microgenomates group bacterium GW2011_GWC1_33_32]KKP51892.1 MAG: Malate dehydrogenase (Oxaloacetate-decarboxylating) [Candidatus Woesebacteria bacterium GW2011_GWB1_33_38]KKP57391.1 MAG: Malate 
MDSIAYHKKYKGKIGTELKSPIENKKDLTLAYTPGVAEVSKLLTKDPKQASFLSLKSNTIAVLSDGSAVLGLGNIGPFGAIPVMEGKAALFKKFAGVDAFPICVNTQNNEEIIKLAHNISPVFGGINLEDIEAPRCFEIERRLIKELDIPVMHDDQHGTAVVVLAALINAIKVVKKSKDLKIVINGAGAAGTAVCELLLKYGFKNIVVCDSQGSINKNRKDLNSEKIRLSELTNKDNEVGDIHKIINGKDVFIGVSKGNLINKSDIKNMSKDAIVFAMANPTPEIMPDEAKLGGAKVIATGRSDFNNQINNVLAFPGIFRGALDNKVKKITNKMLISAAINLSKLVKTPTAKKIIPSPFEKGVVKAVSSAIR